MPKAKCKPGQFAIWREPGQLHARLLKVNGHTGGSCGEYCYATTKPEIDHIAGTWEHYLHPVVSTALLDIAADYAMLLANDSCLIEELLPQPAILTFGNSRDVKTLVKFKFRPIPYGHIEFRDFNWQVSLYIQGKFVNRETHMCFWRSLKHIAKDCRAKLSEKAINSTLN